MSKEPNRGFTLIEILLVVAMFGIVAGFSAPLAASVIWRTDLAQGQYLTVTSLRRAQILSQAQVNDSDWGVHIENNILTIFEGNDFNARDTALDEVTDLNSVNVTQPSNVVFHKMTGKPYENSYSLSLTSNQETVNINVNSEGVIEY